MNERGLEIKVGALVIAAVAILVGFVVAIGDLSVRRTWPVFVEYGFVGAIHSGAPVRLAGVKVGRVGGVELLSEPHRDSRGKPLLIRLRLDLDSAVRGLFRDDTQFHIGTAGVLGEVYVDAVTGSMAGAVLEPGVAVRGVDPPRTDLLLSLVYGLMENVSDMLEEDGETLSELLHRIARFSRAAESIFESPEELASLVSSSRASVDSLARTLDAVAGQLDGGDLALILRRGRLVLDELATELPAAIASIRRASEGMEQAMAVIGELGEEDVAKLKEALVHYEAAGARMESLLGDAQRLVERLERGEGTLGALMTDEQVYEDLRELLSEVKARPWKLLWRR